MSETLSAEIVDQADADMSDQEDRRTSLFLVSRPNPEAEARIHEIRRRMAEERTGQLVEYSPSIGYVALGTVIKNGQQPRV